MYQRQLKKLNSKPNTRHPQVFRQGLGDLLYGNSQLITNRYGRNVQDGGYLLVPHTIFLYHLENQPALRRQPANGLANPVYQVGGNAQLFGIAHIYHRFNVEVIEAGNRIFEMARDIVEAEIFGDGIEIYFQVFYLGQLVPDLPEFDKYIRNNFFGYFLRFYEGETERLQVVKIVIVQSMVGFHVFVQSNALLKIFDV